jgi:hypothetical protein
MLTISLINDGESVSISQTLTEEETKEHASVELDGFHGELQAVEAVDGFMPDNTSELIKTEFENDWSNIVQGQTTPPPEC